EKNKKKKGIPLDRTPDSICHSITFKVIGGFSYLGRHYFQLMAFS
ncbi:hypothetical protein MRB53_031101, partial [Persea americana]